MLSANALDLYDSGEGPREDWRREMQGQSLKRGLCEDWGAENAGPVLEKGLL
jgi:hypothetical protein